MLSLVSFNSGKFAPLVTRTKPNPSVPAIQDPDLFTIAGPPYPGSPTPPPYTSYPAPPEPVTPPPVVYTQTQQSYVATTAPAPAVEVVTEAAAEIKIADVMATKMTPFVDLGEAAEDGTDAGLKEVKEVMKEIMQDSMPEVMKEAIKELPRSSEQGVVKVQLTEDDIRDIMEAVKKETEEAESHSITKTDLVEMAVERLREMEDKLGSDDEDDDGNHNFQAIFLSW